MQRYERVECDAQRFSDRLGILLWVHVKRELRIPSGIKSPVQAADSTTSGAVLLGTLKPGGRYDARAIFCHVAFIG